jgi:NAD(P)-dependent dehydrogenase (short-subunit alcohol dehydrogenase family)
VVFGATGGIGSALSSLLASQPGAQLLLSGRDADKLAAAREKAAAAAQAGDAEVATAAADPLDPAAVEGVIQEAVQRYGRIDGVANCVGNVLLKPGDVPKWLNLTCGWQRCCCSRLAFSTLALECSLMPDPNTPSPASIPVHAAHTTSLEEFENVLRVNLFSSFGILRATAKAMSKPANGGGSIVLCSSAVARHGIANHEAIAAAKVGIE